MIRTFLPFFSVTVLLASAALSEPVISSSVSAGEEISGVDVGALLQQLSEQEERLKKQEQELASQRKRVQMLTQQVSKLVTANNLSTLAPAAGAAATRGSTTAETPEEVGVSRRQREKDRPPRVEAVENSGGVLLRPGQAVAETSMEYSRSSATRVAIEGFTIIPALNIGSFEISQVDRDTVIAAETFRLGLLDRFEAEVRVPYVFRDDNTLSRPLGTGSSDEELSNISGEDIGDIEIAGRYQITDGQGGWPFLIGNLRFKSTTGKDPFEVPLDPDTGLQTELPTGSGFYALQPSLTAILPSDPVVLYGSVGYLYNMKRDIGGRYGEIDPGDSISASFGMGFSVNERTSFSLGYSHNYVFETEQNGETVPNSDKLQIGSLQTGFGYRLDDHWSLNLNVDAGLTDDAPDVRVMFRVPYSFQLY